MTDFNHGEFTRNDVLKLARLARIDLDEAEVEKFTTEFAAILHYVEQLQAVDVGGLEPTSQVTGLTNVMRPDFPQDYGYKVKELLKNVPDLENGQIKVQRMIG
jgi:aspartyl-tRNA(Asn)/glutamyl-tRNA(Gln) amidotransferase subunit C